MIYDHSTLRNLLAGWEPAAGPTGFEGLVAQALALLTGYTFRLAKSGSQFGRDAGTPHGRFAIAMEAKRYKDSVPLQELVGKSALAGFALEQRVDVWVLAATVEVNETSTNSISEVLETHGITALILDWADAGLPRLAVLLAAVKDDLLNWIENTDSTPCRHQIASLLTDVINDQRYISARDKLREDLSAGTVGLGAFRRSTELWAIDRFSRRRKSQEAFSQFVVPLEADIVVVSRAKIHAELDRVLGARPREGIVAVLGGEGAGKTWIVTQWWLEACPRPILLLSIGRIAIHLRAEDDALSMLARLAAAQHESHDEASVQRWRKRFANWSTADEPALRFCVVLDGLNETSGKSWATILRTLSLAVADLSGVLIVTCREQYWEREVKSRLAYVPVTTVLVTDYDDDEFSTLITKVGLDQKDIPPHLNIFMRNPRICALALQLLPQLGAVQALTVERLLFEYWRARMLERGDLIGHDERDFTKLLMSHARAYRERPGVSFDRDDWLEHSGAIRRADGRDLRNDLTEIEEGRFFDAANGTYSFRPEALRFALGLLMSNELRSVLGNFALAEDITEAAQGIVDSVAGFDIIADIIAAAIGISCLDKNYPDRGIAALVSCFASLQNLDNSHWDSLFPHVSQRPNPFLDAYEIHEDDQLFSFLLRESNRDPVETAFSSRINRWLGGWTRETIRAGATDRHRERNDRIDANLAALHPAERELFNRFCTERPKSSRLARAAVHFLAGRAQATHAQGIVAYAFALAVGMDIGAPTEDLRWAIRLNRLDYPKLADEIRSIVALFSTEEASTTAKRAGAQCLRFLGTKEDAARAECLDPIQLNGGWRLADRYCSVDPLNPNNAMPENIVNAIDVANKLTADQLWNSMSQTGEDHELEMVTPGLARYRPEPLVALLRKTVESARTRAGLPLRQLGWRLPWLSPLFDEDCLAAIRSVLSRLEQVPSITPPGDLHFITGMVTESILPHLTAEQQLAVLVDLPEESPYYLRYLALLKPLNATVADQWLINLKAADNRCGLVRTLHQLAIEMPRISGQSRAIVEEFLASEDDDVFVAALEAAVALRDERLDDVVLRMEPPPAGVRTYRANSLRRAFTTVVGRRRRVDLLGMVPVEHLDWLAIQLPETVPILADAVEACIDRLLEPIATPFPVAAQLQVQAVANSLDMRIHIEDGAERSDDPVTAFNEIMSDNTGEAFRERRRFLREEAEAFLDSIAHEGALAIARLPYASCLYRVAAEFPDRTRVLLNRILATTDAEILRNVKNLALPLARSFSAQDEILAARIFSHIWPLTPHIDVVFRPEMLRLNDLMLFGAAPSLEIDALRRETLRKARNDAEIEKLVLAAEQQGLGNWIAGFVSECMTSPFPADQGLGLTIASLRPANSQSDALMEIDNEERGFLAAVIEKRGNQYRKDVWARHWADLACSTEDPLDYWRYAELAMESADRRTAAWLKKEIGQREHELGGDISHGLSRRIEKLARAAEQTLFGLRAPQRELAELLF